MNIQQIVKYRLEKKDFKIFNRHGEPLSPELIYQDYCSIRGYLAHLNQDTRQVVAIKLVKDYHYFLTLLACQEIGLTYIPMEASYPQSRIDQIKQETRFKLLIDEKALDEMLKYQGKEIEVFEVSPDHPAYIMFTSGSTGMPKGVIIPRKALSNFYEWLDNYFNDITPEDRLLQVTDFTFDISLVDVGLFLKKNIAIYFSNFQANLIKLAWEIESHQISCLNTVPNNLNMFLSDLLAGRTNYEALRHLFIAGSRFSMGLYEKCKKYFGPHVKVHNLYGPTECTVYSHGKTLSFNEKQDSFDNNISIGKPLTGVFSIIVLEGKKVSGLERGELYLGGIQLMKGYVNNSELTSNALVQFEGQTYYKTGDIAFMDEKGDYYIVGRMDDTIKYRGFRINLLDIDSYIQKLPYVQDVATIAVENEQLETQTISFIITKEAKTVPELKADLSALLLDFQIPEKIFFVDSLPVTANGKIDRKALKQNHLNTRST